MKRRTFSEEVKQAMTRVVESHQHNHPLYQSTRITESVIDARQKIAAWILFEQIDTDRLIPEVEDTLRTIAGPGHPLQTLMPTDVSDEGWLGDQFRYSLWVMKAGRKPQQIYEDHAYIRPRTKSELTGTRGRDCTLKNLRIEKNKIKVLYPEGEKVEDQEWKELFFNL